jgi:hypothetical protein
MFSTQATKDAQGVRALRGSLKCMAEQLEARDEALKQLEELHRDSLAANDRLMARLEQLEQQQQTKDMQLGVAKGTQVQTPTRRVSTESSSSAVWVTVQGEQCRSAWTPAETPKATQVEMAELLARAEAAEERLTKANGLIESWRTRAETVEAATATEAMLTEHSGEREASLESVAAADSAQRADALHPRTPTIVLEESLSTPTDARVTNLQRRFPQHPIETIRTALDGCEGHTGMAARALEAAATTPSSDIIGGVLSAEPISATVDIAGIVASTPDADRSARAGQPGLLTGGEDGSNACALAATLAMERAALEKEFSEREARAHAASDAAEKAAATAATELANVRTRLATSERRHAEETEALRHELTEATARIGALEAVASSVGTVERLEGQLQDVNAQLEVLRAEKGAALERTAIAEAGAAEALKEVESLRDAEETSKRKLAAEMWALRESHQRTVEQIEASLATERRKNSQLRRSLPDMQEVRAATVNRQRNDVEAAAQEGAQCRRSCPDVGGAGGGHT